MKNITISHLGDTYMSNKGIRKCVEITNIKFRIVAKSCWNGEGWNQEGVTKGWIN